jgi:2,3-dihydroxybenzoate decarboxylase
MDYPWQFVPGEVGVFDAMDVDDAAKKAFFEDNARRVFRIE